jgi:hypothetical protein
MKGLATDFQTTMVVVTHEKGFAREAASRVLMMATAGSLRGDARALFPRAAEERTKQFLSKILDIGLLRAAGKLRRAIADRPIARRARPGGRGHLHRLCPNPWGGEQNPSLPARRPHPGSPRQMTARRAGTKPPGAQAFPVGERAAADGPGKRPPPRKASTAARNQRSACALSHRPARRLAVRAGSFSPWKKVAVGSAVLDERSWRWEAVGAESRFRRRPAEPRTRPHP